MPKEDFDVFVLQMNAELQFIQKNICDKYWGECRISMSCDEAREKLKMKNIGMTFMLNDGNH
jgi:hypothetical protein